MNNLVGVRELKHRYKMLVANKATIQSQDMANDIPISTGSAVIDSFLLEKIKQTVSIADYEHLKRSWQLIQKMNAKEEKIIIANLGGMLNDHKILLAAKFFSEGDDTNCELLLRSLPFSWKLIFPLVFIKPATVFFDGWKKNLEFRLFNNFSFGKLRDFYTKTMDESRDTAILKYRERIHETTALLGYRFETNKEKAIENWCFHNGTKATELPLVDLYVRARRKLNENGKPEFIRELLSSKERLPITSFMGLLSSKDIILFADGNEKLQDYVVECASPIESILRLREWSSWIKENHANEISKKMKNQRENSNIPFPKIAQAYFSVPARTREILTDTVYIPLLKAFGESKRFLLPKQFCLLQPANFLHIDNFLLFNVFNAASKGEMVLIGEKTDYSFSFSVEEIRNVVNMERIDAQQFLLKKFGGLTSNYTHSYDAQRILSALNKQQKGDLLIFNAPFFSNLKVIEQLMKWSKVINLSSYFGAPTEISIKYSYDEIFNFKKRVRAFNLRQGAATYNAITYLEKLHWFEKAGGAYNG